MKQASRTSSFVYAIPERENSTGQSQVEKRKSSFVYNISANTEKKKHGAIQHSENLVYVFRTIAQFISDHFYIVVSVWIFFIGVALLIAGSLASAYVTNFEYGGWYGGVAVMVAAITGFFHRSRETVSIGLAFHVLAIFLCVASFGNDSEGFRFADSLESCFDNEDKTIYGSGSLRDLATTCGRSSDDQCGCIDDQDDCIYIAVEDGITCGDMMSNYPARLAASISFGVIGAVVCFIYSLDLCYTAHLMALKEEGDQDEEEAKRKKDVKNLFVADDGDEEIDDDDEENNNGEKEFNSNDELLDEPLDTSSAKLDTTELVALDDESDDDDEDEENGDEIEEDEEENEEDDPEEDAEEDAEESSKENSKDGKASDEDDNIYDE